MTTSPIIPIGWSWSPAPPDVIETAFEQMVVNGTQHTPAFPTIYHACYSGWPLAGCVTLNNLVVGFGEICIYAGVVGICVFASVLMFEVKQP